MCNLSRESPMPVFYRDVFYAGTQSFRTIQLYWHSTAITLQNFSQFSFLVFFLFFFYSTSRIVPHTDSNLATYWALILILVLNNKQNLMLFLHKTNVNLKTTAAFQNIFTRYNITQPGSTIVCGSICRVKRHMDAYKTWIDDQFSSK